MAIPNKARASHATTKTETIAIEVVSSLFMAMLLFRFEPSMKSLAEPIPEVNGTRDGLRGETPTVTESS